MRGQRGAWIATGTNWTPWLLAALIAVALFAQSTAATDAQAGAQQSVVHVAQLPPEARTTLQLIERGGPFPYRKDGSVFANRERRLPPRTRGYYREYTVPTPGESDRGAHRIVTGRDGERYYSADHYRSFRRIIQ